MVDAQVAGAAAELQEAPENLPILVVVAELLIPTTPLWAARQATHPSQTGQRRHLEFVPTLEASLVRALRLVLLV